MGRFLNLESWIPSPQKPIHSTSATEIAGAHRFFLPLHYTPTYQYPLIVWLHSHGYNEQQIDDVMPYISTRNYVGVGIRAARAADSAGHRYGWHQSGAAIAAAHHSIIRGIEAATDRYSVHPQRIILAGYRDGGTMALRIAMRQPERFSAAVSLGGPMPQGSIRNIVQLRQRRLPMLWQWAGQRPEFTAENLKADCRLAMTIGGQVEVRQYPGDDEMDTVVLKDFNDFIMRLLFDHSSSTASDRWASSPTSYSIN